MYVEKPKHFEYGRDVTGRDMEEFGPNRNWIVDRSRTVPLKCSIIRRLVSKCIIVSCVLRRG